MSTLPRVAERWLQDLARHLAPLPEAERAEAVAELRSHLEERAAQGAPDLLAPFGPADGYAAQLVEARALSGALARGTPWALGRALVAGAGRVAWWYVVVALALVQLVGVALVACAFAKLAFPDRVGLFVGPHAFWLGARAGDDLAGTVDLLGGWTFPAFLLLGVGGIAASVLALRAGARWRLQRLQALRAA